MLLLVVSVAITVFLLAAFIIVALSGQQAIDARLMEVAASAPSPTESGISLDSTPSSALGQIAFGVTRFLKPVRDLISGNDQDLGHRLSLAGFRKPEHLEIYTAAKMLLPVAGLGAATFAGDNMLMVAMVSIVAGFFGPDFAVGHLVNRRQDSIRRTLPDALDLLCICMEAGLGIDQALVRVGEDIKLSSPELAEELMIINREQRAGKPRLEAWRSMAERVDIDFIRQFVSMLVQTERFGTPIAGALGQFADSVREKRMQASEEKAAKTGVKLLFPLVLFIFPSIFVVTLGPAVLNIQKSLNEFFK
jgi:tight adherence protein C